MHQIIDEKQAELESLYTQFHVRRLELFGSATEAHFDPERSDLDFVVEFEELQPGQYARCYLGLLTALRDLFQRPVDLVMLSAIRNPYLLADIAVTRMVLYAA